MAEPSRYTFTYDEILRLLVKEAGIHEGRWQLVFQFGLKALHVQPPGSASPLLPGAVVTVSSVGLSRLPDNAPMLPGLTVEAAKVNPKPEAKTADA